MEILNEIYGSVIDFWLVPVMITSVLLSVAYLCYACRNVALTYIKTGKIRSFGTDDSVWEEVKEPHVVVGIMGSFLFFCVPSFMLLTWPFTASVLILAGMVGIPVHRKRKKVAFMQALKGEEK